MGLVAPGAAVARDIQNGIDNFTPLVTGRASIAFHGRNKSSDLLPLRVGQKGRKKKLSENTAVGLAPCRGDIAGDRKIISGQAKSVNMLGEFGTVKRVTAKWIMSGYTGGLGRA